MKTGKMAHCESIAALQTDLVSFEDMVLPSNVLTSHTTSNINMTGNMQVPGISRFQLVTLARQGDHWKDVVANHNNCDRPEDDLAFSL